MQDELIKYQTAKLAKEKGFNLDNYLIIDDENPRNLSSNFNPREYQPWYLSITQSLLQRWLREKHDIHVSPQTGLGHDVWWSYIWIEISTNDILFDKDGSFDTFEQALEEGLYTALKLIKNE